MLLIQRHEEVLFQTFDGKVCANQIIGKIYFKPMRLYRVLVWIAITTEGKITSDLAQWDRSLLLK